MQAEIEAGQDIIPLSWTPKLLLSPMAMENILVDEDKQKQSAKITVTNAEDKDRLLKSSLLCRDRWHRVDNFVDISLDTLCLISFYWGTSPSTA